MENGFFLSEYLSARYLEKGERVSAKHEKEFKKANREKVTDYLIALGLEEFLDDFKKPTPKGKGDGYWFFEEERIIIVSVIDVSKEDKIKLIRDRNYEALADNDAIWLFEFVYKMIANRGFVGKELEKRVEGAYNLLEYPVRSINAQILKSKEELDKIQAFMFHQRNKMLTSPNDNLAWLKYMQEQIQKAMDKGVEVFGQMREIRNEEITDKGVDFFDRMTDEEYAAYQLQDEVGDRAYDIQSEKEEVKKLKQREREIRGIPESIRDIIINDYEPRNDFTQAEIKELLRIKRRCDSLYDESYRQAISEIAAERGMSEEDVAKTKYISNETFSSSEEVLKKAIESTTE